MTNDDFVAPFNKDDPETYTEEIASHAADAPVAPVISPNTISNVARSNGLDEKLSGITNILDLENLRDEYIHQAMEHNYGPNHDVARVAIIKIAERIEDIERNTRRTMYEDQVNNPLVDPHQQYLSELSEEAKNFSTGQGIQIVTKYTDVGMLDEAEAVLQSISLTEEGRMKLKDHILAAREANNPTKPDNTPT